ncbi:hypothetical protein NDU88_005265, partial [Pleurodeles waltl]
TALEGFGNVRTQRGTRTQCHVQNNLRRLGVNYLKKCLFTYNQPTQCVIERGNDCWIQ